MLPEERELAIHPIVPGSVQHNARVLAQIRSLTASLFGVCAGVLGLESLYGFLFYLAGTVVVSALVLRLRAGGGDDNDKEGGGERRRHQQRRPGRFFESALAGLWGGDVVGGLSSFVLTWTLFYGLLRS